MHLKPVHTFYKMSVNACILYKIEVYKQTVNIPANFIVMLTPSLRAYYIFSGPPCGIIFSENFEKISSH